MSDDPIQDVLDEAELRMEEAVSYLRSEMNTIRAGRATPAMLENVKVEYYGSKVPLNQVASVSAPQSDLLVVQPFDRNALDDISRGIMSANMGLNPNNDGEKIRVPVPPLSQERRQELAKKVREQAEEAKISIRNIRRDTKDQIKKTVKEHTLSEDVLYGAEEDLQEITDKYTDMVDRVTNKKENELMQV